MWRHITVFAAMYLAATSGLNEKTLDDFFGSTVINNGTGKNCNTIGGVANGCFECYLCDHISVNTHRAAKHFIQNFELLDDNCTATEICCVSQVDLNDFRSNDKCGLDNPEGEPRRVRPTLRSILQGQYPWRAWVYTIEGSPLCAATYINEDSLALVTSASCVYRYTESDIAVKFDKNRPEKAEVKKIIIHPQFNSQKSHNDIAILVLRRQESLPRTATEACLPLTVPQIGAACIAASINDLQINAVIPRQSGCNSTSLHPSLMCGTIPRNDYPPEIGSGLFCVEENVNTIRYTIYGIMLEQVNEAVSVYTNLTNHLVWLKEKTDTKKENGYTIPKIFTAK